MRLSKQEISIVLVPTWFCNCNCNHCFERILPLTIGSEQWELFFLKIYDLVTAHNVKRLSIYWQGGEVFTMDPNMVRRGLEICSKVFESTDCTIKHHIQTNLLLYNDEWGRIISDYFSGSISSSIDFPNLYRSTPSIGQDEYINAWISKKEEAEKDGFIISIVTLPNVKTLELGAEAFHRFFKDEAAIRNVQINFPFPGLNKNKPVPLNLENLAEFFVELYQIWTESGRYLNLNPFVPLENRILRNNGNLSCTWSYCCADYLFSIGPDGEVGQCDCWISTQKNRNYGYLTDQAVTEILNSKKRSPFLDRPIKMIQNTECGVCEFWKICYGGCPVRAYAFSGDMFSKDHYCSVYRRLFRTIKENGERSVCRKPIREPLCGGMKND